jgi:hypothetical protein
VKSNQAERADALPDSPSAPLRMKYFSLAKTCQWVEIGAIGRKKEGAGGRVLYGLTHLYGSKGTA